TEDVARRGLALPLRDGPVLDADALTGARVRPARDVAGGVDAGRAGLEKRVDEDAVVDLEAGGLRQRGPGPHADADHDQVRGQRLAIIEADVVGRDLRRDVAESERDAARLVQPPDRGAQLGAERPLE